MASQFMELPMVKEISPESLQKNISTTNISLEVKLINIQGLRITKLIDLLNIKNDNTLLCITSTPKV